MLRVSARSGLFATFATLLAAAPASALEFKSYSDESFAAAQSANNSVVIDVYASWCPTCVAQQSVFKKLKDKPEYADVTIMKVDFDKQKDAVRKFGAQRQSTLVAFKGTKEQDRAVGATSTERIEKLIRQSTLN